MRLPTISGIFDALTAAYGLAGRASQLQLASHVRSAVASGGVCCVEAPTGTGKTLGYLAGAIEAMAHAGTPIPVVVATATVGLQEQIIRCDIPRLAAVGAIDPRKVAVAKGRGRYFCPRTAALLEDKKMQDGQSDMFDIDKPVAEGGTRIALDMLKAWRDKAWDGDKDSWPGQIPACWEASCGASADTCVNRACEHFDSCPYMASRAKLATAELIVANHDLVLADLAQRADEQSSTVLPPKRYALIVDEAHNFPEKAVGTRRAVSRLTGSDDWLRKLEAYGETTLSTPRIHKALSRGDGFKLDVFSAGAATLLADLNTFGEHLGATLKFDAGGICSWGLKEPTASIRRQVLAIAVQTLALLNALRAASKAYAEYAEEAGGAEKSFAIRMLAHTHQYRRMAEELHMGFERFCSNDPYVRWVYKNRDGRVSLHTQPLEGKDVLGELLWKTEFPVALVSATLQVGGSFSRFADKAGLPGHAVTNALPPVFDYSRGFLHLPTVTHEPGELGYEDELVTKIGLLADTEVAPGMLILFTSREAMRRVTRRLPEHVSRHMLVQDNRPLPELIEQHKERIDGGTRSILVGLNSMAEGLDLPGKYCGHVVITRLPFAVPGDPVEMARRDLLGDKWFEHAYLADMLTMLIQACGRLIRREDDHGVITLLDKRLGAKRYALQAFNALPGFTRVSKVSEYKAQAAKRGFDLSHGTKVKLSGAPAPAAVTPALALVHSAPEKDAPAAVQDTTKAGVSVTAPDPLAALQRAKQQPTRTGKGLLVTPDTLVEALHRAMPAARGPFPEYEPGYLTTSVQQPCLPAGTAASVWSERQLPQAVMLGLLVMNRPCSAAAPAWQRVLSLRPDLLQYLEVLRAHREDRLDERNSCLSEQDCLQYLTRSLLPVGMPADSDMLAFLDSLEKQTCAILSQAHVLPNKDVLQEIPRAAFALVAVLKPPRVPLPA